MASDFDKHAGEDEHDGGKDHSALLEAKWHGQDAHANDGVGQRDSGGDSHDANREG